MSKPKDDLYATLGVAESASPDEIKKAFRALARECHPDVAGNDPHVAERFKQVRQAYDLLSDPVARAKYDRRRQAAANQRQAPRMPGGFFFWGDAQPSRGGNSPHGGNAREKHNDIDLEDLFSEGGGAADFGLGGGGGSARQNQGSRARESSGEGTPGRDIAMTFDVPIDIAERGGLVTAQYNRLRRSDDGESLFNYDELYDVRVPPGTRHGDTLRERAWGHAGANGGAYGDLVLDVRIVGAARPREAPKPAGRINLRAGFRHGDRPPERPQERPADSSYDRPPERPAEQPMSAPPSAATSAGPIRRRPWSSRRARSSCRSPWWRPCLAAASTSRRPRARSCSTSPAAPRAARGSACAAKGWRAPTAGRRTSPCSFVWWCPRCSTPRARSSCAASPT
ncbi:MAG: J domain-containing protein [Deltaproteobacteria bacterium]|nr:J domain-containing protein [Deltaproteobacteria bacterium]